MAAPDILDPPVRAKPSVDIDALALLHPELMEAGHIYVHCHYKPPFEDSLIRIWKTTFLLDANGPSRAQLIHAENITYAPVWTLIPARRPYSFLLIFTMLPKDCRVFDLVEDIPQPGGFVVHSIVRNEKDVYHVDLGDD